MESIQRNVPIAPIFQFPYFAYPLSLTLPAPLCSKQAIPSAASMEKERESQAQPEEINYHTFLAWLLPLLLDYDLLNTLSASHVINSPYFVHASPLSVLRTPGQGNCLLDAALLSIYGQSDRRCHLRHCLSLLMTSVLQPLFFARFIAETQEEMRHMTYMQQALGPNTTISASSNGSAETLAPSTTTVPSADSISAEKKEWEQMVKRVQQDNIPLEPIHVFILCHVLRRPIIVLGQTWIEGTSDKTTRPSEHQGQNNDRHRQTVQVPMDLAHTEASTPASTLSSAPLTPSTLSSSTASPSSQSSPTTSDPTSSSSFIMQPNSCVGIYLPLLYHHVCDYSACAENTHPQPILISYHTQPEQHGQGHFSALITREGEGPQPPLIPLMYIQQQQPQPMTTPAASASASAADDKGMAIEEPVIRRLPIRFLLDAERKEEYQQSLLHTYLDLQAFPGTKQAMNSSVVASLAASSPFTFLSSPLLLHYSLYARIVTRPDVRSMSSRAGMAMQEELWQSYIHKAKQVYISRIESNKRQKRESTMASSQQAPAASSASGATVRSPSSASSSSSCLVLSSSPSSKLYGELFMDTEVFDDGDDLSDLAESEMEEGEMEAAADHISQRQQQEERELELAIQMSLALQQEHEQQEQHQHQEQQQQQQQQEETELQQKQQYTPSQEPEAQAPHEGSRINSDLPMP